MKKEFLFLVVNLMVIKFSPCQVICIMCFDQNDSISTGVHNLLLNGGFENTSCNGVNHVFCPNANNYNCTIANWICTGGGISTYAHIIDSASSSTYSLIVEGMNAVYFGNSYTYTCSSLYNDSCLTDTLCSVTGIPHGYPQSQIRYGGASGLSLEQTVSGLIPGNTYVLEFWVGGEFDGIFYKRGIFAVDVGFGDTILRENPTPLGSIGIRYIIEFKATSLSHSIKFTNWGHICHTCTELVLDDARLYTIAELSPTVPSCALNLAPNVNLASSDTSWCDKKAIDYYDLSTNNPTSWYWSFPGAIPDTSNLQNPTGIYYTTVGNFPVTLVACNSVGCDTVTYTSFIHEYVQPPQPVIYSSGDTLCTAQNNSYKWYEASNTTLVLSTSQCFVPPVPGSYFVVVTDTIGCIITSFNFIYTGVGEINSKYFARVIFDRGSDNFFINTNCNGQSEITIYDITSRKLIQQSCLNFISIDAEFLPKGIYLYEIRNEAGVLKKGKIVKN